MISTLEDDRIITSQNALELSCPNCEFGLVLELQADAGNTEPAKPYKDPPDNQLTGSEASAIYSNKRSAIAARKAKILRGLVNLPPMPHIILKARETIADPASSSKDLAKSAGYVAGVPGQVTDIDPDIPGYLQIDPQDLETIAMAMIDDVQKIEKEIKET
jgi:hypothetical protein